MGWTIGCIVLLAPEQVLLHHLHLLLVLCETALVAGSGILEIIIKCEMIFNHDVFHVYIHAHLLHLILVCFYGFSILVTGLHILYLSKLVSKSDLILLYLVFHVKQMLVIVLNLPLLGRIIIVALLKDLYLLLDIVSLLLVLTALLLRPSRSYLGVLSVPLLAHHSAYFLQRQLLVVRGMLGIWRYLELLVTLLAVDRCTPIHESLLGYD